MPPTMLKNFTKCLAYTLSGKVDTLLKDGMKDFVHTFLIRNLTKAVASSFCNFSSPEAWSKVRQNGDLGFHQLRDLYNFVKENITPNPIVVDADNLLLRACLMHTVKKLVLNSRKE